MAGPVTSHDIEALLPMIRVLVAKRYRFCGIDHEDLVQVGMEGVCKAAQRFDPSRASFSSYAYLRALGEIRDYLRAQQAGSRRNPEQEPLSLSLERSEYATIGDDLPVEDTHDGLTWHDVEAELGVRDGGIVRLYTEGFFLRDIADGQGLTEGGVSRRLSKARASLKPMLRAA